jgi:glutamyl/glutaminyl-tRNA synthetase
VTISEIVRAALRLTPTEFLELRRRLDRQEAKLWKTELLVTSAELRKQGIRDKDIDRIEIRRRREGCR